MNNKVLVNLKVPELDESYNVYLPANRKIGNIIKLLVKAIIEMTEISLQDDGNIYLYDGYTGTKFDINKILKDTSIRNGSILILL